LTKEEHPPLIQVLVTPVEINIEILPTYYIELQATSGLLICKCFCALLSDFGRIYFYQYFYFTKIIFNLCTQHRNCHVGSI